MGSYQMPLENRDAEAKRVGRLYLEKTLRSCWKRMAGYYQGHRALIISTLRKVSRRVFPSLSTAISL